MHRMANKLSEKLYDFQNEPINEICIENVRKNIHPHGQIQQMGGIL